MYDPNIKVTHIIPESRLQLTYIQGLAIGVGSSERKRLKNTDIFQKSNKILSELIKICGTGVLFFSFLLKGKIQAAKMLVVFRFWVCKRILQMIIKIQLFILQLNQKPFLTLIKIIIMSDLLMKKIKIERDHNDEALILGNGPSLKSISLRKEMAFMENKAIFAVNYFARTAEYKKVKPEFYVITSPEYFLNEQKEDYANERIITLKTIFKETVLADGSHYPVNSEKKYPLEISSNR